MPGYRRVRGSVLNRLRDSDTAKDVVSRVFSGTGTGKHRIPTRYPSAGTLIAGLGADHLPVAVVYLLDVPEHKVDEVVDDIARLQLMSAAFRPIFVMDSPRLDAARRYGYAAELLVSPDHWTFNDVRWDDYAARRTADIFRRYKASLSITVPPSGVNRTVRIALQAASQF